MDIPGFQLCMLPLLKVLADGHQHSLIEAVDSVADQLQVPPEKRTQLRESGVNILYNTVAWAKTYLKHAGLLCYPVRGMMQITDEGRELLESGVQNIDIKFLDRYSSFVEFKNRKGTKSASVFNPDGTEKLFFESPEDDVSFSGSFIPAERQIWVFAPGPQAKFWDDCRSGSIAVFGAKSLGSLDVYNSKDEMQQKLKEGNSSDTEPSNNALAAWEFSRVMKEADLVIAKKGNRKIVGVGIVRGNYRKGRVSSHEGSRLQKSKKQLNIGLHERKKTANPQQHCRVPDLHQTVG